MPNQQRLGSSVVYQIYIRSFCDSNGDGIGDLPGITSKLDYLAYLGVDYLWITPFYPSPQRDNGYDVSDYCAIDPVFGTMEDFGALVTAAREHGIGIMLDMVLCHTSIEHEWFQRALSGEERYRRFYILRDGRGSTGPDDPGEPPTDWQCAFGGSAWEWEPRLSKWYLHLHDVSQPDLDWTNPEVRSAMADVVCFWRERGVSGFRFDVINLISKPEHFVDDTEGLGRRLFADGPHVHEYLRELVSRTGIEDMVTVGEMASTDLENCIRYTRPSDRELSMTFSFHHLKVDYANGDKWALADPDIPSLRSIFRTWQEGMQAGGGWNALFWDNHDQPRAVTRLGGRRGVGERDDSWDLIGKMLATLSFFMKGTPYIYQGDELGMVNPGFTSIDEFRDVETLNQYRILLDSGKTEEEALRIVNERSRDNGRTPMQWSAGPHAGFTESKPWIDIPTSFRTINVESETHVEGSMLEFYRRLIGLRHMLPVISEGTVKFLADDPVAPKLIAFERDLADGGAGSTADGRIDIAADGETHATPGNSTHRGKSSPSHLLVLCSFDSMPCTASIPAEATRDCTRLIGNYDTEPEVTTEAGARTAHVTLRPYEAAVFVR